jgi:hypothetical protein
MSDASIEAMRSAWAQHREVAKSARSWVEDLCFVAEGRDGCGLGLFARVPLRAEQVITEYGGPRLPLSMLEDGKGEYALEVSNTQTFIDGGWDNWPLCGPSAHTSAPGRGPHCPRYPAIFANHSSVPNARFERRTVSKPSDKLQLRYRMVIVASERIGAGMEIRVDYECGRADYWTNGRTPLETEWRAHYVDPPPPYVNEPRIAEWELPANEATPLTAKNGIIPWVGEAGGDVRLKKLVPLLHRGNPSDWPMIASHLPGRSGPECRRRWSELVSESSGQPRATAVSSEPKSLADAHYAGDADPLAAVDQPSGAGLEDHPLVPAADAPVSIALRAPIAVAAQVPVVLAAGAPSGSLARAPVVSVAPVQSLPTTLPTSRSAVAHEDDSAAQAVLVPCEEVVGVPPTSSARMASPTMYDDPPGASPSANKDPDVQAALQQARQRWAEKDSVELAAPSVASRVTETYSALPQPWPAKKSEPAAPARSSGVPERHPLLQSDSLGLPLDEKPLNLQPAVRVNARKRKSAGYPESCQCHSTGCLKRYCVCFAAGNQCTLGLCKCVGCGNDEGEAAAAKRAVKMKSRLRQPEELHVTEHRDGERSGAPSVRCTCSRSGCVKAYCECYRLGIGCTTACRCTACRNTFGAVEAHAEHASSCAGEGSGAGASVPSNAAVDMGMPSNAAVDMGMPSNAAVDMVMASAGAWGEAMMRVGADVATSEAVAMDLGEAMRPRTPPPPSLPAGVAAGVTTEEAGAAAASACVDGSSATDEATAAATVVAASVLGSSLERDSIGRIELPPGWKLVRRGVRSGTYPVYVSPGGTTVVRSRARAWEKAIAGTVPVQAALPALPALPVATTEMGPQCRVAPGLRPPHMTPHMHQRLNPLHAIASTVPVQAVLPALPALPVATTEMGPQCRVAPGLWPPHMAPHMQRLNPLHAQAAGAVFAQDTHHAQPMVGDVNVLGMGMVEELD